MIILRPLVTAAVVPILIQEIVHASAGLLQNFFPPVLTAAHQKGREQYILSTPGRPVVQTVLPVSHPFKPFRQIGRVNPSLKLISDSFCDRRTHLFQRRLQQIKGGRHHCPCFTGKQVNNRVGHIRNRIICSEKMPVMSRKVPGAFIADGKDPIYNVIHKTPLILHALCQHQGCQCPALGKIAVLISGSVPRPAKIHKLRGRQIRPLKPQILFSQPKGFLPPLPVKTFPRFSLRYRCIRMVYGHLPLKPLCNFTKHPPIPPLFFLIKHA